MIGSKAASSGYVLFLGGLTTLAGFTLGWYGWLMVRGMSGPGRPDGPGLLDLLYPSRIGRVDQAVRGGPPSGGPTLAPGSAPLPGGGGTIGAPPTGATTDPNGRIIPPGGSAGPAGTPASGGGALGAIFGPAAGR